MSTQFPPVGTRVTLTQEIDRYPHFRLPPGMTGVVSLSDEGGIWVKMDVYIEGAEDWDNEIQWSEDLYEEHVDWVTEFYKEVAVHAPIVTDKYSVEFPGFGELDIEIPVGFVDASWKNDACPCFIDYQKDICLWIDHKNPAERDIEDTPRFSVTRLEGGQHPVIGDNNLVASDDWNEIVAFIDAYKGWVPPMNDLVSRFCNGTLELLEARANAAAIKRLQEKKWIDDLDSLLKDDDPDTDQAAARDLAEHIVQRCDEYIDFAEAQIKRLQDDPMSMYLPIGAVIRVKEDVARADNIFQSYRELPLPGSFGVVTGLSSGSSTLMVTFPDGVTLFNQDELEAQDGNPVTLALDAEMLEVVNYAHFHDNRQCRSFEFVPTHTNDKGEAVMVISIGCNHLRLQEKEDGNLECVEVIERDHTFPGVVSRLVIGEQEESTTSPRP